MSSYQRYNGKWLIPDIPSEFNKILKSIGYNKVERHIFKSSKVYINATLEEKENKDDEVLILNVESSMYKNTHSYPLNNDPVIQEDAKGSIIEMTGWLDNGVIQTKTIYPEKGITLIDTREILDSGDCLHKLILHGGLDDPIEATVTYKKVE